MGKFVMMKKKIKTKPLQHKVGPHQLLKRLQQFKTRCSTLAGKNENHFIFVRDWEWLQWGNRLLHSRKFSGGAHRKKSNIHNWNTHKKLFIHKNTQERGFQLVFTSALLSLVQVLHLIVTFTCVDPPRRSQLHPGQGRFLRYLSMSFPETNCAEGFKTFDWHWTIDSPTQQHPVVPQTKTSRGRWSKGKVIGLFLLRQWSWGLSGGLRDYPFPGKESGGLDWRMNQLMLMDLFLLNILCSEQLVTINSKAESWQ